MRLGIVVVYLVDEKNEKFTNPLKVGDIIKVDVVVDGTKKTQNVEII